MKSFQVIFAFLFLTQQVIAQQKHDSLFDDQAPLPIALSLSIKQVRNSKDDTAYLSHLLYYYSSEKNKDSIKVGLKARGNFRLRECYFPPLTISIEKKNAKHTLFEGNKKLKLVLPCHDVNNNNDLILKEYICYKLYEAFTPYAFKTRLADVELTEERKKNTKSFQLKGILIEDVDKTARRCNAKAVKNVVPAEAMDDTNALRFDFFQLLIANTDWSKSYQHNSKLIYERPNYIPLPYDFDMSGVVDAPYAVVSEVGGQQLPIYSVTQRFYRGNCRSAATTEFVRKEYLSKEKELMAVPDLVKGQLADDEINDIKKFLEEFFDILKDDKLFEREITGRCR